jgi:hypothetical protein
MKMRLRPSTLLIDLGPLEADLTLNGRNIPFVNNVKYLGIIFNKRTYIKIYCLFKSERLSAHIKLTLHKELVRSVMTCSCPIWQLAADIYILKLQRLQNKVLRTFGNFPRFQSVRDLYTYFSRPYVRLYNKTVRATGRSHTKL